MKRTLLLSAAIVLIALVFFAGLCVAGGEVTKPIKTMWTGTAYLVSINGVNCPDQYQYINIAKGVSTLWGEVDYLSGYCGTFDVDTEENIIFTGNGWGIVTGANGDRAYLLFDLTVNSTSGKIEQEEEFIGGTGRFEGVEGLTSSTGNSTFTPPNTFPYNYGVLANPSNWQATTTGSLTFPNP